MAEILDESKIRYINNGEPHAPEVYNRPTKDLLKEADEKLVETKSGLKSNTIAMVIALG